ncbi:fungal specific transcription factor domain-containing protein [Nannizzia gypsea CBS 118893]|uniref:C6 finger domain transcription factor nscR n=1 Tax=Arthroderma gypseum (strain ATCC MYA-4604 / CBS 118893) TaxID=535722 RepID=E4V6S4_ARTGP|nr:fungal specific transcription factor domain-containing protein [Nannizzia gypsea CBS 118893]EFQ96790.1 fungal specific transcription factor domain-containing protein [Nannizzia gypsea CBS 118893]
MAPVTEVGSPITPGSIMPESPVNGGPTMTTSPNAEYQDIDPDNTSRPRPKPSRRRDKPQLSCNLCRRRKSRCDRQQPCSTCLARGQTCVYVENHPTLTKPSVPLGTTAPSAPHAVHDRLVQLERLVMSLMSDPAQRANYGVTNTSAAEVTPRAGSENGHGPVPGSGAGAGTGNNTNTQGDAPVDGRSECGSMRVTASELRYVGGDHWAAILENIADLKDHFDREEQLRLANSPEELDGNNSDPASKPRFPHALLLYGCRRPASRSEILAALPPKSAVDRYISRYFNCLDLVASSVVHGPSFLNQYEAFWNNPSGAPIVWVGLLFGMICLALLASDLPYASYSNNDTEQQALQADLYREKIVQCLIMGEYTNSGPYVLETMIQYVYVEYIVRTDAGKDNWFLLAIQVNLAMRMGYHRDPSHFPGISPLQGEMRRRVWATVLMSDILVSSQMGMARMIADWKCDTAEPRNLNDNDIDENTTELPPARPETEHTTALGIIARRRMLMALGTISDVTDAVKPSRYPEIMRADGILHDAAASIPPPLKMKPMASSVTDSAQVIMARLFIGHMFYKGQIMLHRRFLYMESPPGEEDKFAYSRNACIDASLGTLNIQHVLDEETCQGGQLYSMRWRVSSMMNHQFLIGTMILCSLLHRGKYLDREEDITAALRTTRAIWMRRSSQSQEAKKAAETVSIVLARVGERRAHGEETNGFSQGMGSSANPAASTMASSEVGMALDEREMLPDSMGMGFYEPDKFVMPGLLGSFTPPDQQSFSFDVNSLERGATLDDWMVMNWPGMTS